MNCFNVVSKGPKIRAVGGEISFYKNYVIHQFKTTGITDTFLPYSDIELEYLVIAGGGGGGNNVGAGGGAGGYRCSVPNEYSGGLSDPEEKYECLKKSPINVIIGSGGRGSYVPNRNRYYGENGGNSSFGNIVSLGGGGGANGGVTLNIYYTGFVGFTGGSGGGSTSYSPSKGLIQGGSGTINQGFNAGTTQSIDNNTFSSSGGGGAGGSSLNVENSGRLGGIGGIGIQSSITGFPFFRAAGGTSDTTQSSGIGGAHGISPLQNTGSGAGDDGKGADGIVIVRYRN